MAGKSGTRGHGAAGAKRRGGPGGSDRDGTGNRGRSASSPGHQKKAAGAGSAREFATGRVVEIGSEPDPGFGEPDPGPGERGPGASYADR